ncbi:MAG: hypothetical protein SGARI_002877 [Bacillariaceae sp.]
MPRQMRAHKIKIPLRNYERALIPQDKYIMNNRIQKLVSPIKEKAHEVDIKDLLSPVVDKAGDALSERRKVFDLLKSKAGSTLETVGGILSHHRILAGRWLKQQLATATNYCSQATPPPKTPRKNDDLTVEEFFSSDSNLPSPPGYQKRKLGDVHDNLDILSPGWEAFRDSDDPEDNEKYCKLVYAVGREMFDELLKPPKSGATAKALEDHELHIRIARHYASRIVDKDHEAGKRFHVLFSVQDAEDRQWTMEENDDQEMGIHSLEYYRQYRLPLILQVHRCLQFVHNPSLRKDEAYTVNFSGFMRNFYHGSKLLEYILKDTGDTFESVFDKLLLVGHCQKVADFGDKSFEYYVDMLKKHGPAVVKMFIGSDFHTDGTWVYEGEPPLHENENALGHAMMLIGVVQVKGGDHGKGDDIYFILQNTGKDKQFVLVRRDYFRGCRKPSLYEPGDARASINFVKYEDEFKVANPEKIHAKKTKCDVSLSSHHFERPSSTQSKRGMRNTTSEGRRYTRWY